MAGKFSGIKALRIRKPTPPADPTTARAISLRRVVVILVCLVTVLAPAPILFFSWHWSQNLSTTKHQGPEPFGRVTRASPSCNRADMYVIAEGNLVSRMEAVCFGSAVSAAVSTESVELVAVTRRLAVQVVWLRGGPSGPGFRDLFDNPEFAVREMSSGELEAILKGGKGGGSNCSRGVHGNGSHACGGSSPAGAFSYGPCAAGFEPHAMRPVSGRLDCSRSISRRAADSPTTPASPLPSVSPLPWTSFTPFPAPRAYVGASLARHWTNMSTPRICGSLEEGIIQCLGALRPAPAVEQVMAMEEQAEERGKQRGERGRLGGASRDSRATPLHQSHGVYIEEQPRVDFPGCRAGLVLNCTVRCLAWAYLGDPSISFTAAGFWAADAARLAASFHPSRFPRLLHITAARRQQCPRPPPGRPDIRWPANQVQLGLDQFRQGRMRLQQQRRRQQQQQGSQTRGRRLGEQAPDVLPSGSATMGGTGALFVLAAGLRALNAEKAGSDAARGMAQAPVPGAGGGVEALAAALMAQRGEMPSALLPGTTAIGEKACMQYQIAELFLLSRTSGLLHAYPSLEAAFVAAQASARGTALVVPPASSEKSPCRPSAYLGQPGNSSLGASGRGSRSQLRADHTGGAGVGSARGGTAEGLHPALAATPTLPPLGSPRALRAVPPGVPQAMEGGAGSGSCAAGSAVGSRSRCGSSSAGVSPLGAPPLQLAAGVAVTGPGLGWQGAAPEAQAFILHRPVSEWSPSRSFPEARWATHFIVNERLKAIFCMVNRVASTSWRLWFHHQEQHQQQQQNQQEQQNVRVMGEASWEQVRRLNRDVGALRSIKYGYPEHEAIPLLTRPDFLKFVFVRNPFTRLLSAITVFIRRSHGLGKSGFAWNQTHTDLLTEFVRKLRKEVAADPDKIDPHFRPQSDVCQLHRIRFNFVGRFEHLEEDMRRVLERLGADPAAAAPAFRSGHAQEPTADSAHMARSFNQEIYNAVLDVYGPDLDVPLNGIRYGPPHSLLQRYGRGSPRQNSSA